MTKYKSLQDLPSKPKGTTFELLIRDDSRDGKEYKALVHNEVLCFKCETDKFDEMITGWFEKADNTSTEEIINDIKDSRYSIDFMNAHKHLNKLSENNNCSIWEVRNSDDLLICIDRSELIIKTRFDDLSLYISDEQIATYMRKRRPNDVIQISDDIIFKTNVFSSINTNNV